MTITEPAAGSAPTIDQLSQARRALIAKRLRRAAAPEAAPDPGVPRLPDDVAPPVSFAQERLWFMEQLSPESNAYALRSAIRLRGELDLTALGAALNDVVARHDSLRMCFPSTPDGQPSVRVVERVEMALRVIPVDPASHEDMLSQSRQLARADLDTPFDLTVAPLLRVLVFQLAPDDHVLHVALHHIITDGLSRPIFWSDWAACYAARLGAAPAPPPLAVRYGDYAAWQRARLAEPAAMANLDYWRRALAGVAPLDLPTDRPRPPELRSAAGGHEFMLDDDLVDRLRRLGHQHGATLFMTLLAGLHAVLYRITGQRDFAIGSPVAGRIRPELEPLIGLFVNMLTLRGEIEPTDAFAALLDRTRDRVVEALTHQEVPFERLVQDLKLARDTSRSPLFQVLFAMHNADGAAVAWPAGLKATWFHTPVRNTRYDLALYVDEVPDGVAAVFGYRTDLFDPATIERLGSMYRALLRAAVARPDAALIDLPLLDEGQRAAVLELGIAPAHAAPDEPPTPCWTLSDVIAPHVVATPAAPAVYADGVTLSYRELDVRANRMAAWLRDRGVGPDCLVGVCVDQSVDLAVVLFGVLRAGAAYVPLDGDQPDSRLASMVDDAQPVLVLANAGYADKFHDSVSVACLEQVLPEIQRHGADPPAPMAGPEDLAYVIYTSGSTGRPKGVAVAHRQLRNYLAGVSERLAAVPGARWALPQSLSFDFAVTVFYLGLATGGCVYLAPRRGTGDDMARYLRQHRIDYLKMTPSHLAALAVDVPARDLLPRKALLLGGEASRLEWAVELARAGTAEVFNHYGPTEATVGITMYRVGPDGSRAGNTPIGTPLADGRVYVLDERLCPVPVGVAGQIYLAGDRLARGYLRRPGLTAEKFLPDPFATQPGTRMYASGDVGRWRPDGQLEFLGRRDGQIKVRGYRVELDEVEAALATCPGVSAAVVLPREDRLVAYLQRTAESSTVDPQPAQLRQHLAASLPEYMLPNRFVWLDRLPLQEHGKVDRRALPEPDADAASTVEHVPPAEGVEAAIAAVWTQVLGVERVGALDDFFDLGGHSLLATRVVARLRRELAGDRSISVMDLFRQRTVRALAALLRDDTPRSGALLHELTRAPVTTVRSYVCVPYGGASAVVFQPLADVLPDGHRLYAVAVPGHDIGLAEEGEPVTVTAQRCVEEILSNVTGPLVVYGHCGPGGALAVAIARRLEQAGRALDALYLGGIFPFARPVHGVLGRLSRLRLAERLRGDRVHENWLQGMGADLGDLDDDQRRFLVRAMRHDAKAAEDYFTDLLHARTTPLRAPVISVVGEHDPGTEFHDERYREWHFLSDTAALVLLEEAGHYFVKFRARELAGILTTVDRELGHAPPPLDPASSWHLTDVSYEPAQPAPSTPADRPAVQATPQPGMRRFTAVTVGQIVSAVGSALTAFAVPLWTFLETESLLRFALFVVLGQVPGILAAPVAGALIDRANRRIAMLIADATALALIAAFAALFWLDQLVPWQSYLFVGLLSVVLTFQRLAYISAVPQLVPKRYLGHAAGMAQIAGGVAQFIVPLVSVGLIATVGLGGVLLIDLASTAFIVLVLLLVRFPQTAPLRRRESIGAEILGGLRFTVRHRGFRAMVLFFAAFNLFLAPLLLLLAPLVLRVAGLDSVASVSLAAGIGAVLGALTMTAWGGPRHRRMHGMLLIAFGFGAAGVVAGLRPSVLLIAAGAFGMGLTLSLVNGIWLTIIQTKVPQRLHARVIALNMVIALSTLPLGQAVVAPILVPRLEPLLLDGGPLASTVGLALGVGPGRGIGLLYVLMGLCVVAVAALSLRVRALARFDDEVADARPDDLVGLEALRERPDRPQWKEGVLNEHGRDSGHLPAPDRARRHARGPRWRRGV